MFSIIGRSKTETNRPWQKTTEKVSKHGIVLEIYRHVVQVTLKYNMLTFQITVFGICSPRIHIYLLFMFFMKSRSRQDFIVFWVKLHVKNSLNCYLWFLYKSTGKNVTYVEQREQKSSCTTKRFVERLRNEYGV